MTPTMRVNAYAAPSAGQPLAPTTIERREVGAQRRAHRHRVRRHLPLRHPHRQRRLGSPALPARAGPRDRRHASPRSAPASPATRWATASASAAWSTRAASATTAATATSSTAVEGMVGTYAATDRDGTTTQGGYSTHVVVDADYVLSVPESLDAAAATPLLCAGITTYSPLKHWERRSGQEGRRRRPRRPRPHGGQDRPRHGRRGHRALAVAEEEEDGLRLGADHYFATSDPDTFEALADSFDLIINTVSAKIDVSAYLGLLDRQRRAGQRRCAGRAAEPQRLRAAHQPALVRRLDDRRHRRDPGDARLLRRARHRLRGRGDRAPTRSTRPTSACSPPTCATAS